MVNVDGRPAAHLGRRVHPRGTLVGGRTREHRNVSHGCTNVSAAAADWLMGVTQVGDLVTVKGTEVRLQPGNGWTAWNVSWDEFVKGSALPGAARAASPRRSPRRTRARWPAGRPRRRPRSAAADAPAERSADRAGPPRRRTGPADAGRPGLAPRRRPGPGRSAQRYAGHPGAGQAAQPELVAVLAYPGDHRVARRPGRAASAAPAVAVDQRDQPVAASAAAAPRRAAARPDWRSRGCGSSRSAIGTRGLGSAIQYVPSPTGAMLSGIRGQVGQRHRRRRRRARRRSSRWVAVSTSISADSSGVSAIPLGKYSPSATTSVRPAAPGGRPAPARWAGAPAGPASSARPGTGRSCR